MQSAHAIDSIQGIPSQCSNTSLITDRPAEQFEIGPLWIEECKDICNFDRTGQVKSKTNSWYSRYDCGGPGNNVITRVTCAKNLEHPGCNVLSLQNEDIRNHDCRLNGQGWICALLSRQVSCMYPKGLNKHKFEHNIRIAECRSNTKSLLNEKKRSN
jgi:hypothetical protein